MYTFIFSLEMYNDIAAIKKYGGVQGEGMVFLETQRGQGGWGGLLEKS